MSKGMGYFKRDLLENMDEEERTALAEMIFDIQGSRGPVTSAEAYLDSMVSTRIVIGFLNKKLFGNWSFSKLAAQKIMNSMDTVHNLLRETPIKGIFSENLDNRNSESLVQGPLKQGNGETDISPRMPENFFVLHEAE